MKIHNMVPQGIVLGPPLWNIYYADAALAVRAHAFMEIGFADDLTCFSNFGLYIQNSELHTEMQQCKSEFHTWWRANQVSFDPSKKSMHVLALHGGEGSKFRML